TTNRAQPTFGRTHRGGTRSDGRRDRTQRARRPRRHDRPVAGGQPIRIIRHHHRSQVLGAVMEFYPSEKKQRLTLAQAIVRFLQVQYSEYDDHQERFIQGLWGIFGHGNVSGLSQALVEYGQDLPYHQPRNEQSMVHASTGFARAKRRKATMACTTSIGPGATNM